eukprot:TRINITY_DN2925_c0_g1_i1.p1 TRINITY_DN2925_c0_g1~~TRINITY_DN2925_c0_g1_i1.p1  ORF type:complete len:209 (-),score=59.71 TRINITY_DN2925_c0_g1_i1:81-707(-)
MSTYKKDFDHLLKFVLIGDSGVGKSCLLLRFTEDSYSESYTSTIGVDFHFRKVDMNGSRVRIQIWDTAGQERFQTITSAYYRGAHGIILVYDITSRESFEHIERWLAQVNLHASPNTLRALVGNKSDLAAERVVQEDEGKELATQMGVPFWETSAKNADNVENMFLSFAQQALVQKEKDAAEEAGKDTPIPYAEVNIKYTGAAHSDCC